MGNKTIMYDGHSVVPSVGIKRIVKGARYEVENPITHEKEWVGDGEVLYDVSEDKHRPVFALKLLQND